MLMDYLPNDVLRCIFAIISSYDRSKLCQVNKHLYTIIMNELSAVEGKYQHYHDIIRDYHMFVRSGFNPLIYSYMTDDLVYDFDVDLAKIIWQRRPPRLNKLYDIIFNAYKRGNRDWINFLRTHVDKLCTSYRRMKKRDQAMLRGAIAGGHEQTMRNLLVFIAPTQSDVKFAYRCNYPRIIDVLKDYGFCTSLSLIYAACSHYCADVLYHEYNNYHEQYWWREISYSIVNVAIRKNHTLLLKSMIDSGYKFNEWYLQYAKRERCNDEIIQLITNVL